MARKGSRQIEVDAVKYRWTISSHDKPGLCIVVESAAGKGRRLVSRVEHGVVIRPGLVRRVILDALVSGWRIEEHGPDFLRQVPEFSEIREAAHQCPCCDYFTLSLRGQYDICPVCFWEDNGIDIDHQDQVSGSNHLPLCQARDNFRSIGSCDEHSKPHVLDEKLRSRFRYSPRLKNEI